MPEPTNVITEPAVQTPAVTEPAPAVTEPAPVAQPAPAPVVDSILDNPIVKAALAAKDVEINNQKAANTMLGGFKKKSQDLEAELGVYKKKDMTEQQLKDQEVLEAKAAADAAKKEAEEARLESLRYKSIIASGLDPEFIPFVKGNTEEEIAASITGLKGIVDKHAKKQTPAPAVQPVEPAQPAAHPLQPTATPAPNPAKPKVYTRADIAAMSPAEYKKNREAIIAQSLNGEIK